MADKKKVNFSLEVDTVNNIQKLANETHRNSSQVVDWLVADAADRILQVKRETMTLEEAEATKVI